MNICYKGRASNPILQLEGPMQSSILRTRTASGRVSARGFVGSTQARKKASWSTD
jgi:hypothetical protein